MIVEEQKFLAEEDGRGVTVDSRIEPDLHAWADETLYIRMLINLISNAMTYSKENGHVSVSLKRSGGEIIGCVEDDGIGIEAEHLPHIWERFYRADTSRTGRKGENHSGLGLSMVKWIVPVSYTHLAGSTFFCYTESGFGHEGRNCGKKPCIRDGQRGSERDH